MMLDAMRYVTGAIVGAGLAGSIMYDVGYRRGTKWGIALGKLAEKHKAKLAAEPSHPQCGCALPHGEVFKIVTGASVTAEDVDRVKAAIAKTYEGGGQEGVWVDEVGTPDFEAVREKARLKILGLYAEKGLIDEGAERQRAKAEPGYLDANGQLQKLQGTYCPTCASRAPCAHNGGELDSNGGFRWPSVPIPNPENCAPSRLYAPAVCEKCARHFGLFVKGGNRNCPHCGAIQSRREAARRASSDLPPAKIGTMRLSHGRPVPEIEADWNVGRCVRCMWPFERQGLERDVNCPHCQRCNVWTRAVDRNRDYQLWLMSRNPGLTSELWDGALVAAPDKDLPALGPIEAKEWWQCPGCNQIVNTLSLNAPLQCGGCGSWMGRIDGPNGGDWEATGLEAGQE